MNNTKIFLQMPSTSPIITTASMLTIHRKNTCPIMPGRHRHRLCFCFRLPLAMTSMRTSNDHKFRHVICNASFQENGSSAGKYEQVPNSTGVAKASYVKLCHELDQWIEIGKIRNWSQKPPLDDVTKWTAEGFLEGKVDVRDALITRLEENGEHDYMFGLAVVDIFIKKEQYGIAKKICEKLDKIPPAPTDSRVALRTFIVSLGQAKEHLEQYIKKHESLQNLTTNFEKLIGRLRKFKVECDGPVGSFQQDLQEAKKEERDGRMDSFQDDLKKAEQMLVKAEEQWIKYINIEKKRFDPEESEEMIDEVSDDHPTVV